MSYVNDLSVVQNDYGYDLEFQLTDATDNPVDLTGATVKIFIAESDATVVKVVGTCTITDAVNGKFKYAVLESDFDEAPKTYLVEAEVEYANKVVTGKDVRIRVYKELPESR